MPLSESEAWALFHEAGCPAWVEAHVQLVHGVAVAMATKLQERGVNVDGALVSVGAILHDVGRAQTQDPTHAHLGANWLRAQGVHDLVVHIVERHTGAGLLPEEASALGLPPGGYVPVTLEEKVVAHADNLCSGPKRVGMDFLERKYRAQNLMEPFRRIEALHEELSVLLGMDAELTTSS
ncbi:MAG: HDIG domain-containing metalloprotein [Thermoplasmatota archaeon]